MTMTTQWKKKLHAPLVWSADGKEIIPHVGGIVEAGSFLKEGNEFVVIPKSIWTLESNGTDDMGNKYAPSYALKSL